MQRMLRNLGSSIVLGDATLWRYMNLSQFLWMLYERSLYFATLSEFEDKWEGKLPSRVIEHTLQKGVARAQGFGVGAEKALATGKWHVGSKGNQAQKEGEAYRFMCWHENKAESVAMWKLYTQGHDGVAIQTTTARMESCLSRLPYLGLGRVDYSGHEIDEEGKPSGGTPLALLKRRSFAHEQEVRVFMHNYDRPDLAAKWAEEFSDKEEGPRGGVVKIDIGHLIERVVASPEYPAWAIPSLQSIVSSAGLAVKVETSDLLKLPGK